MSGIVNTTRQVAKDPMSFLAQAMAIGSSAAIESMEAAGQFELVNSACLPTDGLRKNPEFELWRIVIGDPVPGDPMFTRVTLPKGWQKKPTDHSMWSELVDEQGRHRAGIFYKAASYDRSAHIAPSSRYQIRQDYDKKEIVQFRVMDGTSILFLSSELPEERGNYDKRDGLRSECEAWLDANRPNWRDPVKSWE